MTIAAHKAGVEGSCRGSRKETKPESAQLRYSSFILQRMSTTLPLINWALTFFTQPEKKHYLNVSVFEKQLAKYYSTTNKNNYVPLKKTSLVLFLISFTHKEKGLFHLT